MFCVVHLGTDMWTERINTSDSERMQQCFHYKSMSLPILACLKRNNVKTVTIKHPLELSTGSHRVKDENHILSPVLSQSPLYFMDICTYMVNSCVSG